MLRGITLSRRPRRSLVFLDLHLPDVCRRTSGAARQFDPMADGHVVSQGLTAAPAGTTISDHGSAQRGAGPRRGGNLLMSTDHPIKSDDFVVTRRPQLAGITEHPKLDFADYERRLTSLQATLQLIQQAYLGTAERALHRPRGMGHRRQGQHHAPPDLGAGPAQFQGSSDRGTERTRTCPRYFAALLAASAGRRDTSLRSTGRGTVASWWSA